MVKTYIESNISTQVLVEVAFDGNMGFQEMFQFYQNASQQEIDKLERLIRQRRFKEAWRLVQDVVGTELVGTQF